MNDWPHQIRGVTEALAAIISGARRILVTCPTGGGKTRMMEMLALNYLEDGKRVVLYTHRKRLLEQLSNRMMDRGIYHGIRASGHPDERDHRFQISSIQTEHARCIKSSRWDLHQADLVLVDEAHVNASDMARSILGRHVDAGAAIVGFTATPIDLGGCYDTLITAGNTSELREIGAIVEVRHYAPDEPDCKSVEAELNAGKDPSAKKTAQLFHRPALFGRIWENYNKINHERKPTLCFGPDVAGSLWTAQQFSKMGVRSAHIDGENIWLDGEIHKTTQALWEEILEESKAGRIGVLCNRFVLREGIDAPWLSHLILACVFGSLQTYLQSCGRILRAYPGKDFATCQDHGGNWHRFDSLNADRIWNLGMTSAMHAAVFQDAMRKPDAKEPFLCPKCGRVWKGGTKCAQVKGGCGYELTPWMRSRPVLTSEGDLKVVEGKVHKPKKSYTAPDGPKKWEQMYWRARSKKWDATFRQAFAMFAHENYGRFPDKRWPFMPILWDDEFRPVKDVAMKTLVQKGAPT